MRKLYWKNSPNNPKWIRIAFPHKLARDVKVPAPCECSNAYVMGVNPVDDDRTITSTAICRGCGKERGKLRVDTGTLFGHAEDRAVVVEIERAGGRVF